MKTGPKHEKNATYKMKKNAKNKNATYNQGFPLVRAKGIFWEPEKIFL